MEQLLFGEVAPASKGLQTRRYWRVTLAEGPRGRLRAAVAYALALLIVTATIQRERFGIPVELDGPAVALLGILAFLLAPASALRFWTLPLILPMTGFVLAGYASCALNSGDLTSVARAGTPLFSICFSQSAILTYRVIMFYVVFIAASHLAELRRKPPLIMLSLLLAQTIGSLAFLPLYPTPVSQLFVRGEQFGPGSLAIMGLFLEPNLFGIYAVTTVALWMPIALSVERKPALALILAFLQIGIIGVYMSYTRSTWLALLAVFCLLAAGVLAGLRVGGEHRRRVILLLGGLVVLGFVLSLAIALSLGGGEALSALVARGSRVLEYQAGSGAGRLEIWRMALGEWVHKPWLGWGLLSFEPTTVSSTNGWLYSSLVQTLHDTGVIGLAFMVWLCVGVAVHSWRSFTNASNRIDKGIALGYLSAQVALFFTSQFSSFFWGAPTWTLFGLAVAYGSCLPRGERDDHVGRGRRLLGEAPRPGGPDGAPISPPSDVGGSAELRSFGVPGAR